MKQGTFLYAALITIGLLGVLIIGFKTSWPELLNLKTLSALTAAQVFYFLSAYFLLMLPFGFISSVYRAHGEFIISVMVGNLMRLGLIACIAAILSFGVSANILSLTYAAIAFLTWLGVIIHQRQRYPDLRYGIAVPDKEALRAALSIGPAYAVVPAAMALTIHGTVLLISALASSGATIAAYNTIRTLTSLAKHVTSEFLQVLGVERARQYAQEDWQALSRLYKFVSRVSGCCCGFLGVNFHRPVPRGIKFFPGHRWDYLPHYSVFRRRLLYSHDGQTRNACGAGRSNPARLKLLVWLVRR